MELTLCLLYGLVSAFFTTSWGLYVGVLHVDDILWRIASVDDTWVGVIITMEK